MEIEGTVRTHDNYDAIKRARNKGKPFDPNQTSEVLVNAKDSTGEVAWRDLLISEWGKLGERVADIDRQQDTNMATLMSKVDWSAFKEWIVEQKELHDKFEKGVRTSINVQWAFIGVATSAATAVITFIAAKVFGGS